MRGCRTDEEADERALLLADVAKRMRLAGIELEKARTALQMVATAAPGELRNALAVSGELVGGELRPLGATAVPTFKDIGEQWTSGKLAKQYPDQVRVKRSAHTDVSRLTLYVYPILQDIPIDRVTLDHCEEVMRKLPAKLTPATRQRVGALLARIMNMAVYPLRLIESSPIPRGFLPGAGKPKALAYLYPDEDRRLLACEVVPLEYRLLWGFLSREGEALTLTWGDFDLARGALRLDKNKTDDPRAWALNPGVAAALRLYKERYRPQASADCLVFLDPNGHPHNKFGLPTCSAPI